MGRFEATSSSSPIINNWFLDGLASEVASGRKSASMAAERAVKQGNLIIGTIVTSETYTPKRLTTFTDEGLRTIAPYDAVRATKVASTAILAAAFGDCNMQGQMYQVKPDSPLTKGSKVQLPVRPIHGWRYNAEAHDYDLYVSDPWWECLQGMDVREEIGSLDIIHDDGSFREFGPRFPAPDEPPVELHLYEPGHFYSPLSHKRLASFVVRVGDVLALSNIRRTPLSDSGL